MKDLLRPRHVALASVIVAVNGYAPADVGVPLRTPALESVRPPGSAPVSVSAGDGAPVVVTVKLNGAPTIEEADAELVMVGKTFSVRVSVAPVPRLTQSDRFPP